MIHACDHCCARIENLSVRFRDRMVLEKVNLHVNCGEILTIIGPNGAGKSTLLKAILGEVPYAGTMSFRVNGKTRSKMQIGYLPQKTGFDQDSPVSVRDILAATLESHPIWFSVSRSAEKRIHALLEQVSAFHLLKRRLGELSGGELQRILLSCAIAHDPEMLLLDEPDAGIDAEGLTLFYNLVSDLRSRRHVSIVLVTHDLPGITPYTDRMLLLNRTVLAEGEPHEVLANEALIRQLTPTLWNISRLPSMAGRLPSPSPTDINGGK